MSQEHKKGSDPIRGIVISDDLWSDIIQEGVRRGLSPKSAASATIRILVIERLQEIKRANDSIRYAGARDD